MTVRLRTGVRRLALVLGLVFMSGGLWPAAAQGQEAVAGQGGRTVTAVVVDSVTGSPLPAAEVRVLGRVAETDAAGRFVLRGVPTGSTVEVTRLGYRPVRLEAGAFGATIRLAPEPVLLTTLAVRSASASRLARGTALTVASVDAERMSHGAHTTVAEALDGLEGVSMSRMGAWGSRPVLRGLSGQRVVVMVNGSRVERACAFGMDQGLATVDPATVERIEVVAGPGTALYGSGSIGGVINVVTEGPGSSATAAGGGLSGEARVRASTGAAGGTVGATVRSDRGPLELTLSVDGTRHDDYRTPAGPVDGSGFGHVTAELGAGLGLGPGRELSLRGQLFEGRDIGWPAMPGAEIPSESRRSLSLDYGHQLSAGWLDGLAGRAYVQRLDHEMEVTMRMDAAMPMTSVTTQLSHSTTGGARVQTRLVPHPAVHVDAGLEATGWAAEATRTTERTMGSNPPSELSLHTWPNVRLADLGAFAQGQIRLPASVTLSGGLRLDRIDRTADGWPSAGEWVRTGNLGFAVRLPAGLGARVSLGYGYRTPDPTELFGIALRPDGFIYRGNPELRTETNRNLELGLTFEDDGVSTSITVFRNDLDGLIAPVPSPGDSISGYPVRSYANVDRARLDGVTGSLQWKPANRLRLRGHASYTRGQDRIDHRPLQAVPPLEGGLAIRGMTSSDGPWLELETNGAAAQTRHAEWMNEPETPAYLLLNVRSGTRLAGVDLVLGVDNVLDTAYRGHLDPVRLLRPGRSGYVRASVEF